MAAKKKTKKKTKKGFSPKNPCYRCGAECCQYFAVYIDEPTDLDEIDAVRWYLYHSKVCVYIDKESDWYVHVEAPCRALDDEDSCVVYAGRPMVCRNYKPTACEQVDIDVENIAEFNSVEELDAFFKLNYRVVGRDLKRRYRSFRTP